MLLVVQKSQLKGTGMTDCLEWGERVGLVWDFGFSFLILVF